ncbi:hypothetical protein K439DRAFT_1627818 [Ramaria rubella]|nr:hypothetical protein K439DRAFT_1627818 [Ramaria rubella]
MSRLTSTQIIEQGDYLDPDFDPTSLTVPHLLSLLTLHAIKYPTPYNKSKLVQAFNDKIKPNVEVLKRERIQREGSVASSHGITDGITGQSISDEDPFPEQLPRRYSRRLSRPPSQTPPPTKPDPPKRRRSSAGPSLSRGISSKVVRPSEPALIEQSEPEDEPVKKVGRPRKSAVAAGPQGRRVSQPENVEGYSDNNIFQSGAESSSPTRPSPGSKGSIAVRRPTRRGRTSLSAPPQMPSSSPSRAAPSSPTFNPRLPLVADMPHQKLRFLQQQGVRDTVVEDPMLVFPKLEPRSSSPIFEEGEDQADSVSGEDDTFEPDLSFNAEVSKTIANGGSGRDIVHRNVSSSSRLPSWSQLILSAVTITLAAVVALYKMESASIGYCYAGTNTNPILDKRLASRIAAQECTERLAQQSGGAEAAFNISCTPLPLLPLPEPMACASCPSMAYCTPDSVTCQQSFVLRPHPLAQVPLFLKLFNGLPGFGPVAFPPSCVEDEERKRTTGRLGIALENYLAIARGQRLCIGVSRQTSDGGDVARWGIEVARVHDHLKKVTVIQKKVVRADEFEGLFDQAIDDLKRFGFVITARDSSGTEWIAAVRTHLDLPCKIRVAGRNAWNEWKAHIFASILLLISAYWMRRKIAVQGIESRRVGDLVQVALDTLRNQELAHHTDPIVAPQAYLSSLHLRDLILQDEHSIPARRRLWEKVQKVVEGNTNVRASMEELEGGDEGRVWRWVGGAHRNHIKSP